MECDRNDESEVQLHHFSARIQYNSCTVAAPIRSVFLFDKGCEWEPGCFTDVGEAKGGIHSWYTQKFLLFSKDHRITLCKQ